MKIYIYSFLLGMLCLVACGKTTQVKYDAHKKINILCTTSLIADCIHQIVGEQAEVQWLMGAGTDPHLYKATHHDLSKLRNADIIIYNGLHLEGKMGEVLEKIGKDKPVLAMSDGLDETDIYRSNNAPDPHIWFSVRLWKKGLAHVASKIQEIDTTHKAIYQKNALAYLGELENIHEWIKSEIEKVPKEKRILVTAHDAFGYFGREYGLQVRSLQGISTLAEFGVRDVTDLVNFVTEKKIKMIFVESSIPTKSLEAVVDGCSMKKHTVVLGETLYSDALGEMGTESGTYIGVLKHNLQAILKSF